MSKPARPKPLQQAARPLRACLDLALVLLVGPSLVFVVLYLTDLPPKPGEPPRATRSVRFANEVSRLSLEGTSQLVWFQMERFIVRSKRSRPKGPNLDRKLIEWVERERDAGFPSLALALVEAGTDRRSRATAEDWLIAWLWLQDDLLLAPDPAVARVLERALNGPGNEYRYRLMSSDDIHHGVQWPLAMVFHDAAESTPDGHGRLKRPRSWGRRLDSASQRKAWMVVRHGSRYEVSRPIDERVVSLRSPYTDDFLFQQATVPAPIEPSADDFCVPRGAALLEVAHALDAVLEARLVPDAAEIEARLTHGRHLSELASMQALSETDWEVELDAFRGREIRLAGRTYERGISAHAPSCVTYFLGGRFSKLTGRAGLWDSGNPKRGLPPSDFALEQGEVRHEIAVDGVTRYRSPVQRWDSAPATFSVDLRGARVVQLRVDSLEDASYDWAVWAELKLER